LKSRAIIAPKGLSSSASGIAHIVGHQTTDVDDVRRIAVHRREFVAGRKLGHARALRHEYALCRREERFSVLLGGGVERGRKVIGSVDVADL
jgi:hypothetical protein